MFKCLKADALVVKGVHGHTVAVGGASADAHPIILIDDDNKVCAYLSGAHACLKAGVLEKTITRMVEMGAESSKISLIIGPGLGPRSYEFSVNAPKSFDLSSDTFVFVEDEEHQPKCLIDIEKLIHAKVSELINPNNIHNMHIDTMAVDLYESDNKRKQGIKFADVSAQGPLFFSARRASIENHGENNAAFHNEVARHGAGFVLKS